MPDEPSDPRGDGNNRRNPEPQFNWKGFVLFAVAGALMLFAYMGPKIQTTGKQISYPEFKALVERLEAELGDV